MVYGGSSTNNFISVGTNSTTLTIGAGITISGDAGTIGSNVSTRLVTLQGSITANDPTGTLTLYNVTNQSSIDAINGGTISLSGTSWNNTATGTIPI